jgi:peptidoglycan hydrolase CwlO-like protein
MSQSSNDLLHALKDKQKQLDAVTAMLSVIPDEIKCLSEELNDVFSAITTSEAEIHEINVGIQALQLEAKCRRAEQLILGSQRLIAPRASQQQRSTVDFNTRAGEEASGNQFISF